MDWAQIDPNMVAAKIPHPEELTWYDPKESPFTVRGLYWFEQEKVFQRFPESAFPLLDLKAPGASILARNPTGGQILFETDAARIVVAAKLKSAHTMDHFAATGEMGMDCYLAYPGESYHFEGVTRMSIHGNQYQCEIVKNRGREHKRVILNLPLYMTVEAIRIGLPKDAALLPPQPAESEAPIVFYGTSITQGGCASRPGMLYTNILSRRLNRIFLNFGFSGSGKGEPEIAQLLAQIKNPALYVLTYEANVDDRIFTTLKPFIAILREKHPETPIWVGSRVPVQYVLHTPGERARYESYRLFQKDVVRELTESGDRNIFFVDGNTLLPEAPDECFVDGNHPTDFGFWQIANSLQPMIEKVLKPKC